MAEAKKRGAGRAQRPTTDTNAPPEWFGWLGVAAVFLLVVVRVGTDSGAWFFPLLSLGEWILLPLGVASLTLGLLSLGRITERTLLPLWISAVIPAALWLIAAGLSMLKNGVTPAGGDLFLSWIVHLIFPTMALLPLLAQPVWRDRLMWALAAGLSANVLVIFFQGRGGNAGLLGLGGLLADQYDFAVMLAMAIPLLAAWRGGEAKTNRALATLFSTFLLPMLTLAACYSWCGVMAVAAGLAVAWATWRSLGWVLGIFVCLLIFGYGAESKRERDTEQRRVMTVSAVTGVDKYRAAFETFETRPYFGTGPESYHHMPAPTINPIPWYAALLGGSGLAGLGMWVVLLGELAARSVGHYGRRCLLYGGVLGGVAGLAVAGLWTGVLPEGAGAMVGLLLAVSILEEPAPIPVPRRSARPRNGAKNGAADKSSAASEETKSVV